MKNIITVVFALLIISVAIPSFATCTAGGIGYSTVKSLVEADRLAIKNNPLYSGSSLSLTCNGGNSYTITVYAFNKTNPYHYIVLGNTSWTNGYFNPNDSSHAQNTTFYYIDYYGDGTSAVHSGDPGEPGPPGWPRSTPAGDEQISAHANAWPSLSNYIVVGIPAPIDIYYYPGFGQYGQVQIYANSAAQHSPVGGPWKVVYSCYTFSTASGCPDISTYYDATGTGITVGGVINMDYTYVAPCDGGADITCMDIPGFTKTTGSINGESGPWDYTGSNGSKYHVQYNPATGCYDTYINGQLAHSDSIWSYDPSYLDHSGSGGGTINPLQPTEPDPTNGKTFGNSTTVQHGGSGFGPYSSNMVLHGVPRSGFGPYSTTIYLKPVMGNISSLTRFLNVTGVSLSATKGQTGETYWRGCITDIQDKVSSTFPLGLIPTIGGLVNNLFSGFATPVKPSAPFTIGYPFNWTFDPLGAACDEMGVLVDFIHGAFEFMFTGLFIYACVDLIKHR
jgi:hypothetical protein